MLFFGISLGRQIGLSVFALPLGRRGGQWVRYGKKHVTTSSLVVLRRGTVLYRKVNHSDGNRKDVLAIIK